MTERLNSTECDIQIFFRNLPSQFISPGLLSPCLFNLYAEYIMRNSGLEEAQAGIKIAGRNVVLEKTLESPLDCKEIQPVHSKGDRSWVFFGRTDGKAETPVLWPPHVKSWLIGKGSGAGRDWGQEETGTTEDEMAGWHHQLDGREFEWTPGVGDGQGGLACCSSWVAKSWTWLSDWTVLTGNFL